MYQVGFQALEVPDVPIGPTAQWVERLRPKPNGGSSITTVGRRTQHGFEDEIMPIRLGRLRPTCRGTQDELRRDRRHEQQLKLEMIAVNKPG